MTVHVQPLPNGDVRVTRSFDRGYGASTTALIFTLAEWRAFVLGVRAGEFDPDPEEDRREA